MNKTKIFLNYHFTLVCIFAFALSACFEGNSQSESKNLQNKNRLFTFKIGNQSIKAELAVLPEERQKGLMFREKLKAGEGMLFIFENANKREFWMKNTKIHLDIGYFSPDGKLKEIHAAKPFDLTGVPSRSSEIQFVLEMNFQGFRKEEIKIGDRLNLNDVRQALEQRGFDPDNYNVDP